MEELLYKIVKGDEKAWEDFVEKYSKIVYSICVKYARNYDERMEMFLFIFKKIREKNFKKLKAFKGKAKFSTYLYKISLNLCIDFLRKKKKNNREDVLISEKNPEAEIAVDMTRIRIKEFIEDYIAGLSEKEKRFMELFYKGENPHDAGKKSSIKSPYYTLRKILTDMRKQLEKKFSKKEIMEVIYGSHSL